MRDGRGPGIHRIVEYLVEVGEGGGKRGKKEGREKIDLSFHEKEHSFVILRWKIMRVRKRIRRSVNS